MKKILLAAVLSACFSASAFANQNEIYMVGIDHTFINGGDLVPKHWSANRLVVTIESPVAHQFMNRDFTFGFVGTGAALDGTQNYRFIGSFDGLVKTNLTDKIFVSGKFGVGLVSSGLFHNYAPMNIPAIQFGYDVGVGAGYKLTKNVSANLSLERTNSFINPKVSHAVGNTVAVGFSYKL